jgi:hypothetical protein
VHGNLGNHGEVVTMQNTGPSPVPGIPYGNWMLVLGGAPGTRISGSAACTWASLNPNTFVNYSGDPPRP